MNAKCKNPGVFSMLPPTDNKKLHFNFLGNNKTYIKRIVDVQMCFIIKREKSNKKESSAAGITNTQLNGT
jgi:hypothetical protein